MVVGGSNTGVVQLTQKAGIPDLLVSSDGCFLGIEVKADNGEPSLIQLYHLRKIRESGGYGILLFPKRL